MRFDRLEMTVPSGDDGYARDEAPLGEVVARLAKASDRPEPIVVFLYRTSESELTDECDSHLGVDWQACLALDRFRRYRANVETLRREELREGVKTPAYVFFDPSGEEVARVEGERAADCDSFERALERGWRAAFEQSRKRYVAAMEDLLDAKEEIRDRREKIQAERRNLAEKPDRRKSRVLDREEQELAVELEKVLAEERETRAGLSLREAFRREE